MLIVLYSFAFTVVILNLRRSQLFWPILLVLHRWSWILFFCSIVYFLWDCFGFFHPPTAIFMLILVLLWFIIRTGFIWYTINKLNKSNYPFFPNFKPIPEYKAWPILLYFLKAKNEIQIEGFKQMQCLNFNMDKKNSLNLVIFKNAKDTIRLEFHIFMYLGRVMSQAYTFYSQTRTKIYVTDSSLLPFFGVYPKNWSVKKNPLEPSWQKLYAIHKKQINSQKKPLMRWSVAPIDQIVHRHKILADYNQLQGYIHPHSQWKKDRRLTQEGCYRLWLNTWLMEFFGICLGYNPFIV